LRGRPVVILTGERNAYKSPAVIELLDEGVPGLGIAPGARNKYQGRARTLAHLRLNPISAWCHMLDIAPSVHFCLAMHGAIASSERDCRKSPTAVQRGQFKVSDHKGQVEIVDPRAFSKAISCPDCGPGAFRQAQRRESAFGASAAICWIHLVGRPLSVCVTAIID
jgi:hypothetical protein